MTSLATRSPGSVVSISMSTGGSGYSSAPTVVISGGGGTGAAAVAHMAGTMVESIVLTNSGTGYTSNPTVTISGNASATAFAYTGPFRPATFFRSRFNDMYAVDGMGRGLRWNGADGQMQPIGIQKPAVGPVIKTAAGSGGQYVTSIDVMRGGAGYTVPPAVTLTGGSPEKEAKAVASISGGRVTRIDVTEAGRGYVSVPKVQLSGGCAAGASLTVSVVGRVGDIAIVSGGTGYTGTPTVVFSSAQGLTKANATVSLTGGVITNVTVLAAGTGATATGVTCSVTGGGGSGAVLTPQMLYSVKSVAVANPGTGFLAAPIITFMPDPADTTYVPGAATSTINSSGGISGVQVLAGGDYSLPPTAIVQDNNAEATVTLSQRMAGVYKCCIRYLDDTPETQAGPIPSSISELVEVDAGAASGTMTWSFAHSGLEPRVAAMELWRTTASQSVVLFRVATLKRTDPAFFGSYEDKLSDADLKDTERDGYGLMPVTLPSGQINARRFGVPPGNYGVAVMFQDRAWYGVDTTGENPNSLLFSEVDEPESVPPGNEMVIQESIGDSDALVALIPLATSLLAVQSRHIYKIQYVAQPVIDASIMLASYRGILNDRCWDVMGGVAYIADSYGMYAFDGSQEEPVSAPIDDLWRDRKIDFSRSDLFHVKADPSSRTVRFFHCRVGDNVAAGTYRALCYCVATKAWWEEWHASDITAGANMQIGGRQDVIYGTRGGFLRAGGYADGSSPISYRMRTGCYPLANVDKGSRSLSVLYTPTEGDAELRATLYYNNSDMPRPNAITSDRGDGFVSLSGSSAATLNMKKSRSKLGAANGFAKAYYAGQVDDRSAGSDRHISVAFSGAQTASSNAVKLHAVTIEGTGSG